MQSQVQTPAHHPVYSRVLNATYGGLKAPEWIVLVIIAICVSVQLFMPPIIGVADNGDFARAMSWFGLKHTTTSYQDAFFGWVNLRYVFDPAVRPMDFYTSQSVPLALAVGVNWLLHRWDYFDLRVLGGVYLILLLAALYWLFRSTQNWGTVARATVIVAAAIVLTDVAYVSYFNSMYSEPASLVFCIATFAATIAFLNKPTLLRLAACALVLTLFTTAKPQNVAAGLLVTIFLCRIAFTTGKVFVRRASIVATLAIALCTLAYYRSMPDHLVRTSHYLAVFLGILPGSNDPARNLEEFGIPPQYAEYSGTHPFSPAIPFGSEEFGRDFFAHVSMPKIMLFYVRHPSRLAANMNRVAEFGTTIRQNLGNYTKDSGRPPKTRTDSFTLWTRLRMLFVPRTFPGLVAYGAIALALSAAAWIFNPAGRMYTELFLTAVLAAISQYLVVTVAQSTLEAGKHLYLFRLLFDLCVFATAGGLIVYVAQAWRQHSAINGNTMQAPRATASDPSSLQSR